MRREKGESQQGEEVMALMTRRSNSKCGIDQSKNICNYWKKERQLAKDCQKRKDRQGKKKGEQC